MGHYRFAFDFGTASLGWAVFELDPRTGEPVQLAVVDKNGNQLTFAPMGVCIFEDGYQGKKSKAELRRTPRSARRNRSRTVARRKQLLNTLEQVGWLPAASEKRNQLFLAMPHELRARAASEKITLAELARVLWHMSKHRGFKSNRKVDRNEDNKSQNNTGIVNAANISLQEKLEAEGHKTYGCYLHDRFRKGLGTRIRRHGDKNDAHYEFYPTRKMLLDEFDIIWNEQSRHHELNDDLRQLLGDDIIFYQRPLKPVEPGRCTFFPDEPRLAKWHPAAQAFLILQELGNIKIIRNDGVERRIDFDQQELLFNVLNGGQGLTWLKVRIFLGLSAGDEINLQQGGLKKLHFNKVAASLSGTKRKPGPLADHWGGYTTEQREEILQQIADTQEPEELISWLMQSAGIDRKTAENVENLHLPQGYLRFCKKVTEALVSEMRSDIITYAKAVKRTPLLPDVENAHSDLRPSGYQGLEQLPPYHEVEQIRHMLGSNMRADNPSVHIVLGQFRRVMNMLIDRFGKPAEVVLESARDLGKSPEQKDKIQRQNKANMERNDRFRKTLEEAGLLLSGQRVGDRFEKMRLWEELGAAPEERCSPYSGKQISFAQLHSEEVEIEHILPYANTLDNSFSNKTLAFRNENRAKGKLSPAEAAAQGLFDQDEMIAFTRHLPKNKRWRFLPDAMEVFEEQKTLEDRHLHATGYVARIAQAYANSLFDKTDMDGKKRNHVWMLPGHLTGLLRRHWGLNSAIHNRKNRNDHRHHAIDAAVIGVIDRGMIRKLQETARTAGTVFHALKNMGEPFPGYREQVLDAVARINVSHRPRHGQKGIANSSSTDGRLHQDGAYGLIRDLPQNESDLAFGNIVIRKAVTELSKGEIARIREPKLRASLLQATEPAFAEILNKREAAELLSELLAKWSGDTGHKRVRVIKKNYSVKAVKDKNGKAHKHFIPWEYSCIDIIEMNGEWHGHALSVWDANSESAQSWKDVYPNGRFVMRLYKGDTLQLHDWDKKKKSGIPGVNTIKKIVVLNPARNLVYLCGQYEAGNFKKRYSDKEDPFTWDYAGFDRLRLRRARRVRIDELGRVHTIPHGKM